MSGEQRPPRGWFAVARGGSASPYVACQLVTLTPGGLCMDESPRGRRVTADFLQNVVTGDSQKGAS